MQLWGCTTDSNTKSIRTSKTKFSHYDTYDVTSCKDIIEITVEEKYVLSNERIYLLSIQLGLSQNKI